MLWKEIIKTNKLHYQPITKLGERIRRDVKKFVFEYCNKLSANELNFNNFNLSKIHLFLKPEKIPELQKLLQERFQSDICEWIMYVSEKHLGMKDEYFVDEKFYFRINFPYDYARKSNSIDKTHPLSKYNKGLPKACWSHGPHIDSWYGHSFNAINFWWNVGGVNEQNSMTLHLKKNTSNFIYDEFMYLDKNIQPPTPTKIDMKEGELLLFNSEQLHATRLNTSKDTRFVVTVRVIQNQPVFNKRINHHHYLDWMSSKNIKNKDYSTKKYPNFKILKKKIKKKIKSKYKSLNLKFSIKDKKFFKLIKINQNNILEVNFLDKKILLTKHKNKFFAFNSICPHLGVNLKNGFVLNDKIKCPAHGIEFGLNDGKSGCQLKIRTYKVRVNKKNSKIMIES